MAKVAIAVGSVAIGLFSMFSTTKPQVQKLGEISAQTAKEGEPRLIVWGVVRPVGGNVVAVQEPPRIERRKQKSSGKGGGGKKTTQIIEVPRRTYAIGICEGPITGVRRVWRNNKLVFDGRPDSKWGAKNNAVFRRSFRFYLGDYKQMPDPRLEAIFGVGNVPAMRGTAYMVALDEDLGDTGGALPQWLFEVERASSEALLTSEVYENSSITSAIYVAEFVDESESSASTTHIGKVEGYIERAEWSAGVLSIEKTLTLKSTDIEPDLAESSAAVLSIEKVRLVKYSTYDIPAELAESSAAVLSIEKVRRAGYINYSIKPDAAESSAAVLSIVKTKR